MWSQLKDSTVFAGMYDDKGKIEEAKKVYCQLQQQQPAVYDFSEGWLNTAADAFGDAHRPDAAAHMQELNAEFHPKKSN